MSPLVDCAVAAKSTPETMALSLNCRTRDRDVAGSKELAGDRCIGVDGNGSVAADIIGLETTGIDEESACGKQRVDIDAPAAASASSIRSLSRTDGDGTARRGGGGGKVHA